MAWTHAFDFGRAPGVKQLSGADQEGRPPIIVALALVLKL